MDSITIKVSDLLEIAQILSEYGTKYVNLRIMEADNLDNETIPPCVSFHAINDVDDHMLIDCGEIEEAPGIKLS